MKGQKKVVMEGSAWLALPLTTMSLDEFTEREIKSPYIFAGKTPQQRIEMLKKVHKMALAMCNIEPAQEVSQPEAEPVKPAPTKQKKKK